MELTSSSSVKRALPVVSSWSPTSKASLSVDEREVDKQQRYWTEETGECKLIAELRKAHGRHVNHDRISLNVQLSYYAFHGLLSQR